MNRILYKVKYILKMRKAVLLFLLLLILSCKDQSEKINILEKRVDSLEKVITKMYKPGFGELMTGVQAHHSKLWFAGKNQNWDLAGFEVKEIKEILEDIHQYQKERKESQFMEMLDPALDSVEYAVSKRDPGLFKKTYTSLTRSCNECHQVTDFGYNIVKIPDTSPFTNQDFKIKKVIK